MNVTAAPLAILALVLGSGMAMAKPTVAVLGLEVLDDGSSVDHQSTKFAKELTEAIRAMPRQGSGPYALASGGNKDFVELKLLFGCSQENKDCLARIGSQVTADYLMYGSISRGGASYVVTVKLFSVQDKSVEKVFSDVIPPADMKGAALSAFGARIYEQLTTTREVTPPTQPVAPTMTPTQTTDATAAAPVIVVNDPATSPKPKRHGQVARAMFFVSLAVAVGAASGAVYYGLDVSNHEDDLRDAILAYRETPGNSMAFPPTLSACNDVPGDASAVQAACDAGDRAAGRANIGWTVAGVAAVSAGVFAYVGWRKPKSSRQESKPSTTAWSVVPVISPTAPGAAFTMSF